MGSTSEILLPLRIALDMRGDGASWMEEMNLPAELPETRARVHLIRTLNSDLGDMSQWVFLKCDDPVLQSAHSMSFSKTHQYICLVSLFDHFFCCRRHLCALYI